MRQSHRAARQRRAPPAAAVSSAFETPSARFAPRPLLIRLVLSRRPRSSGELRRSGLQAAALFSTAFAKPRHWFLVQLAAAGCLEPSWELRPVRCRRRAGLRTHSPIATRSPVFLARDTRRNERRRSAEYLARTIFLRRTPRCGLKPREVPRSRRSMA